MEDTFEVDLVDQAALQKIIERDARQVSARLRAAQLFARTVTLKIRLHDFSTHTRSRTVSAPTDRPELITEVARSLLGTVDTTGGVRLLGVGVAGLTDVLQDRLFDDDRALRQASDGARCDATSTGSGDARPALASGRRRHGSEYGPGSGRMALRRTQERARAGSGVPPLAPRVRTWSTRRYGPGWVWGSGADASPYGSRPETPRPGRSAPSPRTIPPLATLAN